MIEFNESYPQIIIKAEELRKFGKSIERFDGLDEDFNFIFHNFYFVIQTNLGKYFYCCTKSENWVSVENNNFFARYQYSTKDFLTYDSDKDNAFKTLKIYCSLMKYIMRKIGERNILEVEVENKNKTKIKNNTVRENKKHHNNRNITTPIYNLVDKRATTVERLIKKRNGWTISHSFQVRGHYRHYKNGKVVFINPYKKGKKRNDTESKGKKYFLSE